MKRRRRRRHHRRLNTHFRFLFQFQSFCSAFLMQSTQQRFRWVDFSIVLFKLKQFNFIIFVYYLTGPSFSSTLCCMYGANELNTFSVIPVSILWKRIINIYFVNKNIYKCTFLWLVLMLIVVI